MTQLLRRHERRFADSVAAATRSRYGVDKRLLSDTTLTALAAGPPPGDASNTSPNPK